MTKKYERGKSVQITDVILGFFYLYFGKKTLLQTENFAKKAQGSVSIRLFLGTSCANVLQDITEHFFNLAQE